jgi:hypothetical protein
MRRPAMKKIAMAAAGVVSATTLGVAGAATKPGITQTAIAHARLGLSAAAYKHLLGKPTFTDKLSQPDGWTKLLFGRRRLAVYFDSTRHAVLITTWNPAYKTAARVGPCTTVSRLKAIYGSRLKPSKFNTQNGIVYAYTVGKNLIFATNGEETVHTVGLYDGSDPNVDKPGGSLSYAGFLALSEAACV